MTSGRRTEVLPLLRRAGLGVTVVVGTGFACLEALLEPSSIASAALVGALGGLVAFVFTVGRGETSPDQRRLHRRAIRGAVLLAGVLAVGVLALTGMVTVLAAATAPVLLLCVLTAVPWTWARSRRIGPGAAGPVADPAPRGGPRPRTVPVVPSPDTALRPAVPVPESLSTTGLCGQWQRSYFALVAATDPAERDRIVGLRRRYLDELERRDPDAVARWLADAARPAGTSPARHLTPAPRPLRASDPPPPAGTEPPDRR